MATAGQNWAVRAPVKFRVIVIEDNEDSAEKLSTWLERLGHDVGVASTVPEGVALAREGRVDVVLCDIDLPGMSGVEVCRTIGDGMAVPPVMMALTGYRQAVRARSSEVGFRYHLGKPVDLEILGALLDTIATEQSFGLA